MTGGVHNGDRSHRNTVGRRAAFSLAFGIAISLIGVTILARSYPWEGNYPVLGYVAAPVPILSDGMFSPSLWILNAIGWALVAWLTVPTLRLAVRATAMLRARWSTPAFRSGRRVLARASLVGLILVLQYIAISNSELIGFSLSDTGSWRGRSLLPVAHAPWWKILEVFRPVLIEPVATIVRFAARHSDRFEGTILTRWLDSSEGVVRTASRQWVLLPHAVAAERLWDAGVATMNTALWFLAAVFLWQVARVRLPSLSLKRYSVIVLVSVIALATMQYSWGQRYRWSGIVVARWDALFGTLAFYDDSYRGPDGAPLKQMTYYFQVKQNLCGVESREGGKEPTAREFSYGYNSVMSGEVERRFGRAWMRDCSDRASKMYCKWYRTPRAKAR